MSDWARISRRLAAISLVGACVVACSSQSPAASWVLVWNDEFSGTALSMSNWKYDVGAGSDFGTQQINSDTNDPSNVSVANGVLSLTAQYDGTNYTSGRIETGGGRYQQQYGRFEASIKIPEGGGMWPGFWLLGANDGSVGWPACGELDIMENRGADPTSVVGSVHGPNGGSNGYDLTAAYKAPGGESLSTGFHQYAIEWEPGVVRFYVDNNLYETQSADLLSNTETWVFNHPFFVILDLAVGGNFGALSPNTTFPQSMQVDYVRIYARPGESPGVDAG